jgi:hypothetical protein
MCSDNCDVLKENLEMFWLRLYTLKGVTDKESLVIIDVESKQFR